MRKAAIGKLAKSKKRPSAMFGGVLCSKCRNIVFDEAIKVNQESKKIEDVSLDIKNYVDSALKKVEG